MAKTAKSSSTSEHHLPTLVIKLEAPEGMGSRDFIDRVARLVCAPTPREFGRDPAARLVLMRDRINAAEKAVRSAAPKILRVATARALKTTARDETIDHFVHRYAAQATSFASLHELVRAEIARKRGFPDRRGGVKLSRVTARARALGYSYRKGCLVRGTLP